MGDRNTILCIGAVLWDTIGRSDRTMKLGHDCPGRISRIPGGVAFNIAAACRAAGMSPQLLGLLGRDPEGAALAAYCTDHGLGVDAMTWSEDLPTDQYMAIEGANGMIAAIADAHSLEAAGDTILTPLRDGTLGSASAPYTGPIALDGNLTEQLLTDMAKDSAFGAADLRVAPASPGKVGRIAPFLDAPNATIYVNRIEANILCDVDHPTARKAAEMLATRSAARILVTDGPEPVAEVHDGTLREAVPPTVAVQRVTGAGDTFLASHVAAEAAGAAPEEALHQALLATSQFVGSL